MRDRPVVNAQRFVEGREAIATVACLDGRVLSMVCLEVVEKLPNLGAATVVKVIHSQAMVDATKTLVHQLGLSGFCGFDYILNEAGHAILLELNPRVTPTAYMLIDCDVEMGRTIALFPADLRRGGLGVATVDVPDWAPAMAEFGARTADRRWGLVSRVERRLTSILDRDAG
jgi:predicted ATP-grasp superfamily ATP-dependent carboligase